MPWSLGKREVKYHKGDCPVAEKRCAEDELDMGGSGWYEDCAELMDQYAAAFRKVAENVGALKDKEEQIINNMG